MKAKNYSESTKQRDGNARITPASVPDPAQLGLTTTLLDKALAAGPIGIRKAQSVAIKFARKFQTETEDHFKKRTKFLQTWFDSNDPNARARARYALVWRPKFLAALSLTYSPTLAARFARTTKQTVYNHRKWDSQFAEQWAQAERDAVELLHSRAFQRALEGVLKGASGDRIVAALRRLATDLGTARAALGTGAASAELEAGVAALRAGATPPVLARLRERRRQSLTVALAVLADLVARGVPVDSAAAAVLVLAPTARDVDLVEFRRAVERDIALGAPPAAATSVRLDATARAAAPGRP